ncbi:uncharacterized protein LOC125429909 [Sphaerodactylus townsendi]|uniref:uncharacterized protein LOC125429909 n=1 Tax=Sphaerodactylus townsendi TaxID=933632 RepID=UPI0020273494|nr:uncharacterized protein LOC125429909 [Sphaerodactylus townsendi]
MESRNHVGGSEKRVERPGNVHHEWKMDYSRWTTSEWEQCNRLQQRWEGQWQDLAKTLQPPCLGLRNSLPLEHEPWDDTNAFLASFEQVARACQWPREEWAARLLPALSGEAQQAFGRLEARDREDYGKVKAAILRGEANRMETLRQHFRQFRSQEMEDPRRIYSQLQELCCQWLRPERHSKEQILELLILEQFLAILPPELQSWIKASSPENCTQAAALAEDFLLSHQGADMGAWPVPLQEKAVNSLETQGTPLIFSQRQIQGEMNDVEIGSTDMTTAALCVMFHSQIHILPCPFSLAAPMFYSSQLEEKSGLKCVTVF